MYRLGARGRYPRFGPTGVESCQEAPAKWKGASGTLRVIDALEGIGTAGAAGIVLSSIATAYESYKEDTGEALEWGTGHKIARAG